MACTIAPQGDADAGAAARLPLPPNVAGGTHPECGRFPVLIWQALQRDSRYAFSKWYFTLKLMSAVDEAKASDERLKVKTIPYKEAAI